MVYHAPPYPWPSPAQVLIFSQFKIMPDVLEDYMALAGYPVERVDGSVKGKDRQVGGAGQGRWGRAGGWRAVALLPALATSIAMVPHHPTQHIVPPPLLLARLCACCLSLQSAIIKPH
jgi:hypothetical protein